MTPQQFNKQFRRLKSKFHYLQDEFLIELAKEYYQNTYLQNIPEAEFIDVISYVISSNYEYMLKINEMIRIHKMLFSKGYNPKCEDCEGNGFVILYSLDKEIEVAVPCYCNKKYSKNYKDFINTGRYRIPMEPLLEDVPKHLAIVRKNNFELFKTLQKIHAKVNSKHVDDLPF